MQTILIIEDEVQTQDIFLKCLEFEGFRAFGASNGTQGIEMTRSHQPDLVICDIMMPDMDGYSVLSALRRCRETAYVPLIFLTAKVTMTDLRRGMDMGADDYLTKPCTLDQFLAAIHTRLQRKEDLTRSPHPASALSKPPTERAEYTLPQGGAAISYPDCPKLNPVFHFIEAHYSQPINLNDVAQAVGYSPAYLTSIVQEETGQTVKRWIVERRMAQARTLLTYSSQSVRQIAEASGYPDAGHFTRQFRKLHTMTPQEWRQTSVAELTN